MKTQPIVAIKKLRQITGQTQEEFAAMIGASKDTVVSWETGRNKLSPTFARRIAFATGVDARFLQEGLEVPMCEDSLGQTREYTAKDFETYRQTLQGRSDAKSAKQHLSHCEDALQLLLMAATKTSGGKSGNKLLAVLDSFIQWCEETREGFDLREAIDEELAKRRFKLGVARTYKEWLPLLENPVVRAEFGLKEKPQPRDYDLRMDLEVVPQWAPGRSMKEPKPASLKVALVEEGSPRVLVRLVRTDGQTSA